MRTRYFALLSILAVIVAASGCAGPRPTNLLLQKAETAYYQAQQDPNVQKYAPKTLEDAGRYLEKAQTGWEKGFNQYHVYFYANLSRQYAESALAQAAEDAAKAEGVSGSVRASKTQLIKTSRLSYGDIK